MTFDEAIDKAAKALDAAKDHGSDVERAREEISAANTWLRMAEILHYTRPRPDSTASEVFDAASA